MAWELKIKETRKDGDTLFVKTEYYDGVTLVETAEVPIFRPKTYDDVLVGLKNRAETIKKKKEAEALIDSKVKPDTDKQVNKPIPTVSVG